MTTRGKRYKKCVTYPQECINCSEGQQKFCEINEDNTSKLPPSLLSETNGEDYV